MKPPYKEPNPPLSPPKHYHYLTSPHLTKTR